MSFYVNCTCGRQLTVSASQAGMSCPCVCGLDVPVPSLGVLRRAQLENTTTNPAIKPESGLALISPGEILLIIFVMICGIVLFSQFGVRAVVPFGYLCWLIGRVWVACLILREMTFPAALVVFVIPFAQFYFALVRFDVTWRAVILSLVGLVMVWSPVIQGLRL